MNIPGKVLAAATLSLLLIPTLSSAHMRWLVPSNTVLSEPGAITFDASISNNVFFPERAFPIDGVTVIDPEGNPVEVSNSLKGKRRSVFDIDAEKEGTYRIAIGASFYFIRYTDKSGERGGWRGDEEGLSAALKDAKEKADGDIHVTESHSRLETFITVGKPSSETLKPSGAGLELKASTHPNDLYAGETAHFTFLLDGKPAKNLTVSVVAGGTRYRNDVSARTFTTDKKGSVAIDWQQAGMYLLEVEAEGKSKTKGVKRRDSYIVTLEVLPE